MFCIAWYTGVQAEKDEAKKAEKRQEVQKATTEKYLKVLETLIQANGGKFLVGGSLTWADIFLANAINHVELINGVQLLDGLPGIKNVSDNVLASPGIKAWLAKRPLTKF